MIKYVTEQVFIEQSNKTLQSYFVMFYSIHNFHVLAVELHYTNKLIVKLMKYLFFKVQTIFAKL